MSGVRGLATRLLLGAPTAAYGAAVRLRNRYYDGKDAQSVGIPVLSVGNVTVGGTGKTPIVAWLARALAAEGSRPAVVSRGYGGRAGAGPLLVSDGGGPRVGAELCGDEPYLLSRTLPGALVIVGSDRVAGGREAKRLGAQVVVLDDGFQHRRIARDLDIVLLDAHDPFGNYELLPAGTLREPLSGLARASLILITRSRPGESLVVIERVVRRHAPTVPLLRAGHRRLGFVDGALRPTARPGRALAFCGIGNPAAFAADLDAEGLSFELRRFADHHRYTARELEVLFRDARAAGAVLVTTEKDLVRIPEAWLRGRETELRALRIEAEIYDREEMLAGVRRALAGTGA